MNIRIKRKNGFSLVEIMVYFSLIGILLIILSGLVVTITKESLRLSYIREVNTSVQLIETKISQAVKNADNVTVLDSSRLEIEKDGQTITFRYDPENQSVTVNNGFELEKISPDQVKIILLSFNQPSSELINFEVIAEHKKIAGPASAYRFSLENSAIVREKIY